MEFLNNAMEIEIYTRRKCKRFPKTERFTTSARLMGLAAEAAGHLSRGNDIYPATQHDVQKRRAHFIDARGVYADMIREEMEQYRRMWDTETSAKEGGNSA